MARRDEDWFDPDLPLPEDETPEFKHEVFLSMQGLGTRPEDLPDPEDAKEYAAWLALSPEDAEAYAAWLAEQKHS